MLDPRLYRLPGVRAGALGITALFFALFGLSYINAQYLQDVKGYSPTITGVCILPIAVAMPIASARNTRIAQQIGARVGTAAGMLIVAGGLIALSFATATTPYAVYGPLLAVIGLGMGLALPPLSGPMTLPVRSTARCCRAHHCRSMPYSPLAACSHSPRPPRDAGSKPGN